MSQPPEPHRVPARAEAARLMELIGSILRLLGFTMRDVARRAGLNHYTTNRYCHGEGEPRLGTLLGIARALGLEYWELFEIAYPAGREPSASGRELRRKLELLMPSSGQPPAAPPPREADLEALIRELQHEVRSLQKKLPGS